jgi:SAM-dependent methyltransferase
MIRRQPHAVMDLNSRILKAKKIEALIDRDSNPKCLLEIGTGSGGIAHYFASVKGAQYCVYACDLVDNIVADKIFDFRLVESVYLPYENESMDVVISNHVIEHVGDEHDQIQHLKEIFRVLKKDGLLYIAVPNRWMLIEPHFKLIFLSWIPRKFRSIYLRISGKGNCYDCEPLEKNTLESFLHQSGFEFNNKCAEALKLTFEIERPDTVITTIIKFIPLSLIRAFSGIIPTLIYIAIRRN